MLDLITDQRKLLKLAVVLSIDIGSLVEAIKSDPLALNYKPRAQFVQGILNFLKEAIGLKKLHHLSDVGPKITTPTGAPVTQLVESICTRLPPISPAHTPLLDTFINAIVQTLIDKNFQEAKPRGNHLTITGVPFEVTSSVFLQQIHGGPLESLLRRAKHGSQNPTICTFVINFLEPEAAEAFFAFTNSPVGHFHFPGAGKLSIAWSHRGDSHITHFLKAARDPVNPARRVLIFNNYPLSTMNRSQMEHRLRSLEKGFLPLGPYCVDDYEIALGEGKIRLIFNCIGAAVKVMELHTCKLLGAEFACCEVVYGRDPADRPIPGQTVSRTLIFYEYFGDSSSKDELRRRLQVLDKGFLSKYSVDEHQIDYVGKKALIVLNCIGAASRIMECYKLRLLGFPFDNCRVIYGIDDLPITTPWDTALAQSPPVQVSTTTPPALDIRTLSPTPIITPPMIIMPSLTSTISFGENKDKDHADVLENGNKDDAILATCPFGDDTIAGTLTLNSTRASNTPAAAPTSASSKVSCPFSLSQAAISSDIWLQAFGSDGSSSAL